MIMRIPFTLTFSFPRSLNAYSPRVLRCFSSTIDSGCTLHVEEAVNTKLIRNVGIIAHIDAGKTTTTERMLYFSHRTRHIGDVDRGDTVTDYLPEERERGISIVSAAACLAWRQHTLHLIDTPGHVDFTMEVERCLTVVDGALTILDGTKGVQAQTKTVWHQADRYNLPRLVFVNKMDREAANFSRAVATLSTRLASKLHYVPIHWPLFEGHFSKRTNSKAKPNAFIGLIDLVSMTLQDWSACESPDSEPVTVNLLQSDSHGLSSTSMRQVLEARMNLLAKMVEVDDVLANEFLLLDHPETLLPPETIRAAVARVTHAGLLVPILLGSSRKNIGIQPLLDAIVDYLPDPSARPISVTAISQALQSHVFSHQHRALDAPVMLVFKIVFDQHWGPLTLVRLYSGLIKKNSSLMNWSRSQHLPVVEKVNAVFQMTGDYHEQVESASVGSIVALAGLKSTHSGDILGPVLPKSDTTNEVNSTMEGLSSYEPIRCDPVVYAALEPRSFSAIKNLEHALNCLQREDPSLVAKLNSETGQWMIGGMGDLHLEIIQSRLQREYKVDARLGNLLIAYKECPVSSISHEKQSASCGFGHAVGSVDGARKAVAVLLTLKPSDQFKPQIHFDKHWIPLVDSHRQYSSTHGFLCRLQHVIQDTCLSTLSTAGPLLRSPVVHASVHIQRLLLGGQDRVPASYESLLEASSDHQPFTVIPFSNQSAATYHTICRSAVIAALKDSIGKMDGWRILEPMISVELRIPVAADERQEPLSQFLTDLAGRRAEILSVDSLYDENETLQRPVSQHVINALAPLSELMGYSTAVRTLSSGRAELQLTLGEYRPVSAQHQERLINQSHYFTP